MLLLLIYNITTRRRSHAHLNYPNILRAGVLHAALVRFVAFIKKQSLSVFFFFCHHLSLYTYAF